MDQLSPALFWDAKPGTVDPDRHEAQVVQRVVERGTLVEWKAMRQYYGDERLRKILMGLRELSPKGVALCCVALDLKKEDFRCCTSRPFPQVPWSY